VAEISEAGLDDNSTNEFLYFYQKPSTNNQLLFLTATERIRTADLMITNHLLYQLSYGGVFGYNP
jgi:hypothetical protein